MKALFELFRRFDARRIFGFIRRLGGMSRPKVKCYDLLSTRALQVESDTPLGLSQRICFIFLSTPSGWRATKIPVRDTEVAVFLSTPFQKAAKIQLLPNELIAVAGTNVGMNAF